MLFQETLPVSFSPLVSSRGLNVGALQNPRLLQKSLAIAGVRTHKHTDSPVFSKASRGGKERKKETRKPKLPDLPNRRIFSLLIKASAFLRQIVTMPFSSSSLTALFSGYGYDTVQ